MAPATVSELVEIHDTKTNRRFAVCRKERADRQVPILNRGQVGRYVVRPWPPAEETADEGIRSPGSPPGDC